MKPFFPIFYGIAISSVVAYYVIKERPNTQHFTVDDIQQDTEQPQQDSVTREAKTEEPIPSDINSIAATPVDGIKITTPKLINEVKNEIAVDENVIYGTLKNGMSYILMQNKKPAGQVSMRLHVGAGSLNEAEDQRGVAHFLEHMVFNGTKNFPDAKNLIPKMQRLGIAFGAHANAYTSFDETVYMLDLPNSEEDTLNLAYTVMQDFAGGALLEEDEINEERGVISSEKTSRDSVGLRLARQFFKELFPESMVAKRFPIGTEEVIQNATRDRFTDFYTRFYRPKNMCFVFVGDFDLKQAEAQIKKSFSSLTEPKNPGAAPSVGKITTGRGFQTAIFTDKEVASTELSLVTVGKNFKTPDTAKNRANKLPLSLAHQILSKRFSDIVLKNEDSPVLSGSASRQVMFKEIEVGSIDVTAKDNNWRAALPLLVSEYKRALEHGFTQSELDEVTANIVNAYENRVKSVSTRQSPDLASSLVANYHNQTVFSTPKTDLAIVKDAIDSITPELCHQAFIAFWSTPDVHLTLTTQKNENEQETKALLASMFRREVTKKTEALAEQAQQEFAYSDWGTPGKVIRSTQVPDLGITQLLLSNGIKVNLKRTTFDANTILLSAFVGDGKLSQPKDKAGIDALATSVMRLGGLNKHSYSDLEQILAGKSVGWSFSIADDAFKLQGKTTKEDLKLQLQLLCAMLTEPGFRPEGERIFRSSLQETYKKLQHSQSGGFNEMESILSGKDPRFTFPDQAAFDALSLNDVKSWIKPALQSGKLELSIVGDFSQKDIKQLLQSTLATLAKRQAPKKNISARSKLPATKFPLKKVITFNSKIPSSTTVIAWRVPMLKETIGEARRINILANILGDRMRIKLREELGKAYSPGTNTDLNSAFENKSYLLAISPGKPEDMEELSSAIIALANELAEKGATQDELTRALEPILSSLAESRKTNSYWLGSVLSQPQQKPYKLDWSRSRETDYKAISLKDVNTLAKKYLSKNNAAQFIITPESAEKTK